jgi:hypothetical protein
MRTKKQTKPQGDGSLPTVLPAPMSNQEVAAKFAKSYCTDNQSGYVPAFLVLMERIYATNKTWSFSDIVNANKVMELPIEVLSDLFNSYCSKLESWGLLTSILGAYDERIYWRV